MNALDGIDRWKTGNYGADQYIDNEICHDCDKDPSTCNCDPGDCNAEMEAEAKRIEKF